MRFKLLCNESLPLDGLSLAFHVKNSSWLMVNVFHLYNSETWQSVWLPEIQKPPTLITIPSQSHCFFMVCLLKVLKSDDQEL